MVLKICLVTCNYESNYNLLLLIICFTFIILRLFIFILTNLLSECLSPICSCRRFLSTHFSKKKQGIVINVYVVIFSIFFLAFCYTPMLLTPYFKFGKCVFINIFIYIYVYFYTDWKLEMF